MSPLKLLLSASLASFMATACTPATPTDTNIKTGDTRISAADLGRRIEKLSSDEFEGRAPSTPGGQAASQYIADEMKLAGLKPMGNNGTYFQNVELTEATVNSATSMMVIKQDGTETPLLSSDQKTNSVYWTKRLDESVTVTDSDLVFVGYGITAPEYGWNDYADLDVKGKTVVILVNDPGFATKDESLFKGNSMTYYGRGLKMDATINQAVKTTTSRNVAAGIQGATRPDEYVLYMAHWDHLGKNDDLEGDDKIYNGAVDNATGTAAIVEIGEAMAAGSTPDRSVIFVAVTAEESGLLGSAYYAESPLVPLNKTVAGINIDAMLPLGETKDVKVIGFGASELEDRLKDVLDKRGMYIVPDDKPEAGYYYRSDHISLAKKGVPMLYADPGNDHITNGLTYGEDFAKDYTAERYHKPGDE